MYPYLLSVLSFMDDVPSELKCPRSTATFIGALEVRSSNESDALKYPLIGLFDVLTMMLRPCRP